MGYRKQMHGSINERRPARPAACRLRLSALLVVLLVAAMGRPAMAADTPRQLVYDVRHSVFGEIGTYSNLIEAAGAIITIKTAAHFLVKALGVGLHSEEANRVEQWQGDRLVFFHGVTVKNGDTTEIKGEAKGNSFVITSPLGTITAPSSVRPANPTSPRSIDSTTMMRVDTGKVENVKVTGGAETNVNVAGASTTAKEYDITGGANNYKIWFDQRGVPIMFVVDDDSGKVTFTLKK